MKDRMVSIRMPDELVEEYKKFCEDNSFTFSKRIRRLMEVDLDKWRRYQSDKNSTNI